MGLLAISLPAGREVLLLLFYCCDWPKNLLIVEYLIRSSGYAFPMTTATSFSLALPRSWNADKMLCVIYRDGTVYCQSSRSSHTGLCDPQWNSSQYACSDEFPYHRWFPAWFLFIPTEKRVNTSRLLCPCRVDTVILSALNLPWLCWDQGSFLYFTWTHYEKMEC